MTGRPIKLLSLVLALTLVGPSSSEETTSRQAELYKQGTEALDTERWDKAAQAFGQAARESGERTDGALYWKAYAEHRLGRKADAAGTLGELKRRFPESRWLKDARALEVEMKAGEGALAAAEDDDELKVIALGGLVQAHPSRALPLVEKLLAGTGSEQVKRQALFVLGQSPAPEARAILFDIARGKRNQALQEEALQQLGVTGGPDSKRVLEEVYASATDEDVKQRVLSSFMVSGDRDRISKAARGEKSPRLRAEAARLLGAMGATGELSELYQAEGDRGVKEAILDGFGMAGDSERLISVVRAEKDVSLRAEAVTRLGMMGREKTEAHLLAIYRGERDPQVKEAVAQALMMNGNAGALVQLAKGENDRRMKAALVQQLSVMQSKEATDYLLEILGK